MRKNKIICCFAFLLLLTIGVVWSAGHSVSQWSPIQQQAEETITRYLDALTQGDTLTISKLLGGKLQQRHKKTLKNPVYASMLSRRYASSHYEITRSEVINDDKVAIDVTIVISDQEIMETKFILQRSSVSTNSNWSPFRIIEERELTE